MIEITWLGHSTFQLRLETGQVYVLDPWTEGNPKFPPGHTFSRVDAILVSHGHFDHIASAAALSRQFGAPVAANYEICTWLKSKGVEQTREMNKGGSQRLGPLTLTMTHAMHSSSLQEEDGRLVYGGEPGGYILEFAGSPAIYFAGDTDVFGDMKLIADLYQPELVFLPIGDLFTMGPRQAEVACRLLRPKTVIPMHWGTFPALTGRPEELAERIQDLKGTEVWTLEPGKPVLW
ncbi:MAG: metal-dependent hydrolase [Acidobacteriia bacterium]|nr:metal-dependent hydrolase [Terriglobia bacterium]